MDIAQGKLLNKLNNEILSPSFLIQSELWKLAHIVVEENTL